MLATQWREIRALVYELSYSLATGGWPLSLFLVLKITEHVQVRDCLASVFIKQTRDAVLPFQQIHRRGDDLSIQQSAAQQVRLQVLAVSRETEVSEFLGLIRGDDQSHLALGRRTRSLELGR